MFFWVFGERQKKSHLMRFFCESTALIGVCSFFFPPPPRRRKRSGPSSGFRNPRPSSSASSAFSSAFSGGGITMNKFRGNGANIELGGNKRQHVVSRESERFFFPSFPLQPQEQQSQTHWLHSCILHGHVLQKKEKMIIN